MLKVYDLRADHQREPVGLAGIPRVGWKLASDGRGVLQRAYHLQVALDADFAAPLLDSRVDSGQSQYVALAGVECKPLSEYFWRVRVWDNHGEDSGWSEPAHFVTALGGGDAWQARFVTAEVPAEPEQSRGSMVRGDFVVAKPLRRAWALTTALGVYHLYLDGKKVGDDQLAPGWTSYHKHLLYQMHDVTDALAPGMHTVGAALGAGWYKGLMGFLGNRNNYGTQTAFLCQLHLLYEDGTTEVVASDESWQGGFGPVLFAEIYDGEVYDARREQPGWCTPGFAAEGWHPVGIVPYDMAVLRPQSGGRVKKHEVFHPEIITTPEGDTVLDFGQNLTGWPRFYAPAAEGEAVRLRCFETLDAAGNVYLANLRSAKQALEYTCGGTARWFEPGFTFYGFRYVKVEQWPGTLRAEDFEAVAVYSDMEETGYFRCDNPDLNQLQSNIGWSMRGNFLDVPTDCPQRNERVGWTGDAQIFCRTAAFLRDVYGFYEKWLTDVVADQTPEGGIPHVVPDLLTGQKNDDWLVGQGTHSASAWADVIVLNPWNLYLVYGDTAILEQNYEPMKRWINFMRNHADGIVWNYRLQFGDWVALDAEEGSYFGATPNDLTCTAYYALSTGVFAKIARLLGREADAAEYGALHQQIKKGYGELFFDETGSLKAQTQTAHIISLYFGLTPPEHHGKTVQGLLRLLEKENGHLVTGFVGTPYFTHALSGAGHTKAAYELLLKDDFPSWLYQVKRGATTIWEHWDGIKPDGTMWSPDMNSFNHYAYGAVGDWLYRVVGGLDTDEASPGYKHSIVAPRPGGGLREAETHLVTVYGPLASHWQVQAGGAIRLNVTVPPGTTARIELFHAASVQDADGLEFTPCPTGLCAEAGSGSYTLVYTPTTHDEENWQHENSACIH